MLQVRSTTDALMMLDRPSSRLERTHTTDAGGQPQTDTLALLIPIKAGFLLRG